MRIIGVIVAAALLISASGRGALLLAETDNSVVTVGVMADGSPAFDIAKSIARALDHQDEMRILTIAGKGPVQTLTDLVQLRGVDAALIPSDAAHYASRNGLLKTGKIAYIAKIASFDVHVIAKRGVGSLADLASKRVAVGTTEGNSFIAANLIFESAGIQFEPLPLDGEEAIRAVAAGTADAAVITGMKPLLASIGVESGLHLLTVPFDEKLAEVYIPSILSAEDYAGLLDKDQISETVALGLVIAVIDWPRKSARYDKIRRFTTALLDAFASDDGGDAGLNFAAEVPGWKRYAAAEDWLKDKQKTAQPGGTVTVSKED